MPGKNLRKINGRSLLQRAIEAASAASHIDCVYVSSDAADILAEAERYGARSILRPAELASDTASSESALLHALDVWEKAGELPDHIAFIQCTSPFLIADDIDGLLEEVRAQQADCGLTVADFAGFLWAPNGDAGLAPIGHDKHVRPRRQDRSPQYLENGAVYVMDTQGFLKAKHRFFGKVAAYVMPADRQVEIDEYADLAIAEALELTRGEAEAKAAVFPDRIDAVIFDFDGVMTNDAAYVDEHGHESVRVSRADGMGVERLRRAGVPMAVMSKETNPVVSRRCEKLKIECLQSVERKGVALTEWARDKGYALSNVIYVGNDINDLEAMALVGFAVCPADAHPRVCAASNLILTRNGGHGAVRELSDRILARLDDASSVVLPNNVSV